MIEIRIKSSDSEQRSDKYLMRLLPGAGKGLIYKQMRKKNITLNGKKMDGSEKLKPDDVIRLFFSDESYKKLCQSPDVNNKANNFDHYLAVYNKYKIDILYEDENIIILNKPAGLLSQGAATNDDSLNDWLIGYLLKSNFITKEGLSSFKPSVLNRLDRNTSGLVIGSKSLIAAITISRLLKERSIHKYYLTIVMGSLKGEGRLEGFHIKDSKNNRVAIKDNLDENDDPKDYDRVITEYRNLKCFNNDKIGKLSLLEVKLITGKSHQIRAHLSSIGHPILGDIKYSSKKLEPVYKALNINSQLLHAYKIEFPDGLTNDMEKLSGKVIECSMPNTWKKLGDIRLKNGD